MKFLVYANLLLAASVSTTPLTYNRNLRYDDDIASLPSVTTSPFFKIIRTSDVTVRDAIYSSPTVAFIGTSDKLLRCVYENPNYCEVFYKTGTAVYSLVTAGEYIYAGLDSGDILRCNIYQKESCKMFKISDEDAVISLTTAYEYIFVGLTNGTTWRCQLYELNSCRPFHRMGSPVFSLFYFNDFIYAGLGDGRLMRYSLSIENSGMQLFDTNSSIYGILNVKNNIFVVTFNKGLWNCSQKADASSDYCEILPLDYVAIKSIATFNGILYILHKQGINSAYKWNNNTAYSNYGDIKDAWSMAFAYGTHQMQSRYKNEDAACIWQSSSICPPTVTYYNARQRAMLKVNVKDGRLFNSFGIFVNTSNADEGRLEPTAIFAMGPDGTILLSNRHIGGLIHTSSLFAGSPVSGAGEMVVMNGVIEAITTCSDHYRPDLSLNRQVLQSLRAQGYEDPIKQQICGDPRLRRT